jgi:hypothetical protein
MADLSPKLDLLRNLGILADLREALGARPNDPSQDFKIEALSVKSILGAWTDRKLGAGYWGETIVDFYRSLAEFTRGQNRPKDRALLMVIAQRSEIDLTTVEKVFDLVGSYDRTLETFELAKKLKVDPKIAATVVDAI